MTVATKCCGHAVTVRPVGCESREAPLFPLAACEAAVVDGVTKQYGRLTALRDFSAVLRPGEIVGVLGPNGAGKSTLLRLLCGLATATRGSVTVLGRSMPRHRCAVLAQVGAVIEAPAFYENLSARENLRILAGYYRHVPAGRVQAVFDLVELRGREDDRVGTYSVGMKRRLGLAAALLPSPRFLILDEPASGLDPEALVMIEGILRSEARDRGVCVLLSSHLLAEVARICDRALVLRQGALIADVPVGPADSGWVEVCVDRPEAALELVRCLPSAPEARLNGEVLVVRVESAGPSDLVARLVTAGYRVSRVAPHAPTIEERYFEVVAHGASGGGDAP